MIFEGIDYTLLFFDILYSLGAGVLAGGINQILCIFFYRGKVWLFIKDILMFFIFSVTVFSFVISFANYPILRYYHVLGAAAGYLSFTPPFSKVFNWVFIKVGQVIKGRIKKILLYFNKILSGAIEKHGKKRQEKQKSKDKMLLQKDVVWVYNL
ncbi:MAG: hypothetical protein RR827_01660 [Oscillospiraceae bacterium]